MLECQALFIIWRPLRVADAVPESCITLWFFFFLTGDKSNGMGCIWFTSRKCCSWTWPSPCKLDTKVKLTEIWHFLCEYLFCGPHESTKQSKTSIEERWYRKEWGYLGPRLFENILWDCADDSVLKDKYIGMIFKVLISMTFKL